MKCSYCGTGILENVDSCPKCGAPFSIQYQKGISQFGTCICGKQISNNIEHHKINKIVCHRCFRTFEGSFDAKYVCDRHYVTGQLTHLYLTAGLECPYCGTVFSGHEFYHGLGEDAPVEKLIKRARMAYSLT